MFNVKRSDVIPSSLAAKISYKDRDVVEALKKDFHEKCYLCETKEPQDINVEHFVAHQGDDNLKYDWKNLYFSCGRCNNIKLHLFNKLLDCCDPNHDVFRAIKLLPPRTPGAKKIVVERQNEDACTIETENLLDRIYNSENTVNKSITGSFLRKKIHTQYIIFIKWVTKYYAGDALETERIEALERIKVLMSNQSQFSAFIKWCVLEDEDLFERLGTYID
jgi:5-methylcytosine-specific restriction endonuclease McrA